MKYKESTALSNAQLDECRRLIKLVKNYKFLWTKRWIPLRKEIRNDMVWTMIGCAVNCVPYDQTGMAAKTKFFKLRKKFCQEVRKEEESIPRSIAGAGKPTYTSDWPLYKDLEFLKNVIKPKRCQHLFLRKISDFPKKNVNQRPSSSPSLPATIIQRSPSPSCSSWNSDLESTLSSGSDTDNSSSMSSLPPSAASVKRTALDFSYVKKKKFKGDVAIAIDKYSDKLSILTDKLNKCLESLAPLTTQRNQPEDLLLSVLAAALARVPQKKKLSCFIKILQVVQKYATEK